MAEQTLYTFCSQINCTDGSSPYAGLIMDLAGNLYGTTLTGGAHDKGTVFKLVPNGSGWSETVLYDFCSQAYCTDGSRPFGGLVMDAAGNLYGTTSDGGSVCYGYDRCGTAFKLTPIGAGWTETIIYTFCAQTDCSDGAFPSSGLIMDEVGNLYGTTDGGGSHNQGTVFRLAPTGTGWTETVLYAFCAQTDCSDGANPAANVLMDEAGNLYGTTPSAVFKLAPTGTGWDETVLYTFCTQINCTGGTYLTGGLITDGAGNLYGMTEGGGTNNGGTVFKLSPTGTGWTETVLYSFCAQTNCSDGRSPWRATLIMDATGNLYGTTYWGGRGGYDGTVFKLSPTSTGWTETVLYSFCAQTNCGDGYLPVAGVIMDAAGNLYGTTTICGSTCGGTVFQLNGWALSVSVIGNSGGTVTSSPSGIDCGSICSADFPRGTQVTLSATGAAGWGLAGWGGVCSGIAPSCNVTLNGDTSVSATFTTFFAALLFSSPMPHHCHLGCYRLCRWRRPRFERQRSVPADGADQAGDLVEGAGERPAERARRHPGDPGDIEPGAAEQPRRARQMQPVGDQYDPPFAECV
jgi:uncharacterized repeat protein (TIGR03803 family)